MTLTINGVKKTYPNNTVQQVSDLQKSLDTTWDITLVNGFTATLDKKLRQDDEVVLINRGEIPSEDTLEVLMSARHTPKVHQVFKKAKVAIAGLGGLGSNVAVALARAGIGEMLLVDFDVVEPSNLNRQSYEIQDIGRHKCDALIDQLKRINPYNTYTGMCHKIEPGDAPTLFADCDVVVEAFDSPEYKAMLVNKVLTDTDKPIVSASGMAGLYDPNEIKSERIMGRLYLCGDGVNAAKEGEGLMAPRVIIAAGHQASLVCRILLGKLDIND